MLTLNAVKKNWSKQEKESHPTASKMHRTV
jgi:hypothetical protein